jgi:hypothetical protein
MKQIQTQILAKYDLNTLHLPLLEPFLGSMYWTAASPLPNKSLFNPSLAVSKSTLAESSEWIIQCSSSTCTSPVKNTVEIAVVTPSSHGYPSLTRELSTDSTEVLSEDEDAIANLNNSCNLGGMNKRNMDVSKELLDYSILDEDAESCTPHTPRRLFEEEEMVTPSRFLARSFSEHATIRGEDIETIPSTGRTPVPNNISPTMSEINMEVTRINFSTPSNQTTSPPKPLPPSPNIATFYGHWGSRRERHVSTLPSQVADRPIRLRVTETRQNDLFSYDPYFSSGNYVITTDGRPYGNGVFMRMGTQFMTLEDGRGSTLAVIKSRYTHVPSTVVYAPKPRFAGQAPSGHRLSNLNGECLEHPSSELYPWAMMRKEGRTMGDSCTVHLVDESIVRTSAKGRNSGMFVTIPTFRGRHEFDGEWNTHTVVARSVLKKKGESEEVPCCVIVRDPKNVDAVDVTIAPGIDPLLMICYLASHSKLDVEPLMGGF